MELPSVDAKQFYQVCIKSISCNVTAIRKAITSMQPPNLRHLLSGNVSQNIFFEIRLCGACGTYLCHPLRSGYRSLDSRTEFDESIVSPVPIKDLPLDAFIECKLMALTAPGQHRCVAQCIVPVWHQRKGTLRRGCKIVTLDEPSEPEPNQVQHPGDAASHSSGRLARHSTSSSSKGLAAPQTVYSSVIGTSLQPAKLSSRIHKLRRGDFPSLPWLDQLTIMRSEQIHKSMEFGISSTELEIQLPSFNAVIRYVDASARAAGSIVQSASLGVYDAAAGMESANDRQMRVLRMHDESLLSQAEPTAEDWERITQVSATLPTVQPSAADTALLLQYRHFLKKDKLAVFKFLRCVDWGDSKMCEDALKIVTSLKSSQELDATDALQLLQPDVAFSPVRNVAVNILSQVTDRQLLDILHPLVQALRYDAATINRSQLANFLINRALSSKPVAFTLYWYLETERSARQQPMGGASVNAVYSVLVARLKHEMAAQDKSKLHLSEQQFRQKELVDALLALTSAVKQEKGSNDKKVEALRKMINDPNTCENLKIKFPFSKFPSHIPLPTDPDKMAVGLIAEKCTVFKSSMAPIGVHLLLDDGSTAGLIVKGGDDIRQDQLVLQLICIMDDLLRRCGMDLCLSPYKALATSYDSGLIEWVSDSYRLSDVLKQYNGDISAFLKDNNPSSNESGIDPRAYKNFVRSCAGYAVVTYLLGIGDRHLDNILLRKDGRLFHIDFGFILGRDPKPMPPPIRMVKEMVAAMGGPQGQSFTEFLQLCGEAFNFIRRHGQLLVGVCSLMKDADIQDISGNSATDPQFSDRQLFKLWERMHMSMSDAQAAEHIKHLVNESVKAFMPQLMEFAHRFKQNYL